MSRTRARMLGALLLLFATAARADVLMVYSLQRHGARNVLPKTATLKESDATGGPTLLPEGQRQAYDAGVAYRSRFLSGCAANQLCLDTAVTEPGPEYGVVGAADGTFNNFNTLVRSSSLDRSIMTARSFLDAVFPAINQPTNTTYLPDGQQVVPVYSQPEDGNALIRGYTACPAYDRRLTAWYESEEFKAKEAATQAFRDGIAAVAPNLNTSLAQWWNVYDGFDVYRSYNVGTPMPPIDDATFAEMEKLAYWLEISKMRSSLTENLLGGRLLGDLLSYIDAAVAATSAKLVPSIYYKLVHLSGHYNTHMGVLGALEIDQEANAAELTWLKKIPALAALMAFELHGDTSAGQQPQELFVRLVMQDGPSAAYTTIPLPCASPGDSAEAIAGPGACTLEAFKALAEPKAIKSLEAWCDVCENESWLACRLQMASRELKGDLETSASGSTSSGGGSGSGLSAGAVAGIAIACAVLGAVLAGAAAVLYGRCKQGRQQQAMLVAVNQQGGFLPGSV